MRLCIQRVLEGAVAVDGRTLASIGKGLVVLVGFGQADGPELAESDVFSGMARKLVELRIFPGEGEYAHKMHCTVREAGGNILLIPQFTLYADCRRGRRPDFTAAAPPATARALFDAYVRRVDEMMQGSVYSGLFGADMRISLCNWGPVTLWLDSAELFSPPAKG